MRATFVFLLLAATIATTCLAQTTSLSSLTSNNTAACSTSAPPAYCSAAFKGMSDSTSGTYNAAPGNVSNVDIRTLLSPGNTTQVYAHMQPWFCMQPGSTATGSGTLCQSHIQVGYNSNDSATVNGQMDDMVRRGFNGVVVDWYGPSLNYYNAMMQKVRDNTEPRCAGPQACPLLNALLVDQGSFQWADGAGFNGCPMNGNGTDRTNCILTKLEHDFDYANANYFEKNSYLKIDTNPGSSAYMKPSPSGKPVVLFFICEECWTNPAPDWTYIWNQLRAHTNAYSSGTPAMFFIFRNKPAFSHVQTNGGFAWVNWDNSNGTDLYGLNYLAQFYTTATSAVAANPNLITMGGGWKGFDETNAPWVSGASRTIGQQCGNTWLQTIRKANQYYYAGGPTLPFVGISTWNDYEEGTEIETGIDNCLTVSANMAGNVLKWQPKFSSSSGSEDTVNRYEVYAGTNPTSLVKLAELGVGSRNLDLSQFPFFSSGQNYSVYVRAVGQPSILNKISNAVKYRKK
jgi:hypothetical protein